MMLWKTKVWRGQKQIQSLMSLNSERSATLLSTCVFTKLIVMILNFPNPKYFINCKKGDSVQHWSGVFRVQEDKGWLYIYPTINDKRTKVDVKQCFFEPGTEADWVFNDWWKFYELEEYLSFSKYELSCLNHQ